MGPVFSRQVGNWMSRKWGKYTGEQVGRSALMHYEDANMFNTWTGGPVFSWRDQQVGTWMSWKLKTNICWGISSQLGKSTLMIIMPPSYISHNSIVIVTRVMFDQRADLPTCWPANVSTFDITVSNEVTLFLGTMFQYGCSW